MKIFDLFSDGKDMYYQLVGGVCERYGLTVMEFSVLMFLANNPEYDTAAQIVAKRNLTKSHVSVSLRSLEERGLVRGERGTDRRAVHLRVLPAAEPIVRDGRAAQEDFGRRLYAGFAPDEMESLLRCLERVNGNIAKFKEEQAQ